MHHIFTTALASLPSSAVAELPSPTQGTWFLGPLPIRAYALCILTGVVVAVWLANRRWVARGGEDGFLLDVAIWAVPFGILGARTYHVLTHPADYFGQGHDLVDVFKIWEGGIAIFGGLLAGSAMFWLLTRKAGVQFTSALAAVVPGVLIAQSLGRWGNWFNNELHGGPTDLPWGLRVYQWDLAAGRAVEDAAGNPVVAGVFHPTFLYESLWTLSAALVLLWAERRWRFSALQTIAAYLVLYGSGRFWIEHLRTDISETILGLRTNAFTAAVIVLVGIALWALRRDEGPWQAAGSPGEESDLGDEPEADEQGEAEKITNTPAETKPAG